MRAPRICVQVAFLEELHPLAQRLRAGAVRATDGFLLSDAIVQGASVRLAASGMGLDRAASAASLLAREPPDAALITGFGAANRAGLRAGAVVMATEVCKDGANKSLLPDSRLSAFARATPGKVESGSFHSLEAILRTTQEKHMAAARLGAAIVEMETFAAAEVYQRAGVPWVALRAVSDSLCAPLPLDFSRCLDRGTGQIDRARLARGLLCHPCAWPEFVRLAVRSKAAARNLAEWVEQYLLRLIPALARL